MSQVSSLFGPQDVHLFVPEHNTPGKKDATGAFQPAARRFCEYHSLDPDDVVSVINNRLPFRKRADVVLNVLKREPGRQVVAFFCHGWSTGVQFGFRSPEHDRFGRVDRVRWDGLVRRLAGSLNATVPLYACSTGWGRGQDRPRDPEEPWCSQWDAPGTGDNSFGDLLRDCLCLFGAEWCRVATHDSAGHTAHNPDVVLFDGAGMPYGARGGQRLVPRKGSPYRAALRRLLRRDRPKHGKGWGLAWRLPFMAPRDIALEIQAEVNR